MVYNTGAALLDAIVLAVVSREQEGTYGYRITQEVREAIDISEIYPVSGTQKAAEGRLPGDV